MKTLTLSELAGVLGCCRRSVYAYINRGLLTPIKRGDGLHVFNAAEARRLKATLRERVPIGRPKKYA